MANAILGIVPSDGLRVTVSALLNFYKICKLVLIAPSDVFMLSTTLKLN